MGVAESELVIAEKRFKGLMRSEAEGEKEGKRKKSEANE